MIKSDVFVKQAVTGGYIGIPYSRLDCQAFIERVLKDCGLSRNWKGSNHMWRKALKWKGTYEEALSTFGKIPAGAWLFTIKNDGGEKARGYNDNLGNASHVGIYVGSCGKMESIHSTTGGVQWGKCPAPRWTHVGLAIDIDYANGCKCPLCGRY